MSVNLAYVMSYNDLLVDISESFGIWVAVLVVLSSHLTVLSIVHNSSSTRANKLPNSRTLHNLLKYLSFKKKI